MCRRNQQLGLAVIALGIGIQIGIRLGAGFWCSCLAFGLICLGIVILLKK